MKAKKVMFYFGLIFGIVTLMSTTCTKKDGNSPGGNTCSGTVSATATGFFTMDYCFDVEVSYDYTPNESVSYVVRKDADPITSFSISLNGNISSTGTYQCGKDDPGYVEIDIHGDESEYYKAQSGSITVTKMDATHFTASFDVTLKGYYNNETIQLKGTVAK